jgi:hypothetical protein
MYLYYTRIEFSGAMEETRGPYHCVNLGAFPVLGHLKSSWCTVGRGTGWKSGEHCLHFLLTLKQFLFASHYSSTSNGLAGSAHSGTRYHRTCKGIYPLQAKTQKHISSCSLELKKNKAEDSSIFLTLLLGSELSKWTVMSMVLDVILQFRTLCNLTSHRLLGSGT